MSSSQDDNSERKGRRKSSSPEIQSIKSTSTKMSEHQQQKPTPLTPIKKHKPRKPLDLTSDDISSLHTSRSDLHSYRDKLKTRFQRMKQTGKRKTSSTFRSHANNIITLNRSLDTMRRENVAIDTQFRAYRRTGSLESAVSKTEKYQFFCESLPDSWALDSLHEAGEKSEGVKEDNAELVVFKSAECKKEEVRLAEEEMFWTVSNVPLRLEEKVADQPRRFEEEGLYVSKKNKMPKSVVNIIERRLHSIDDKKWFDESGKMIQLENPSRKTSFRPEEYSTSLNLEVEYVAAASPAMITNLDSVHVAQSDILEINIHNVKFKHHPLFSIEHVLQEKLIAGYDVHREFVAGGKLERCRRKLEGLRKAVGVSKEIARAGGDCVAVNANYQAQIKRVRGEYFGMCGLYRENVKAVLGTWKCLKGVREANGFSSTGIKLVIRKIERDYAVEAEEMRAFFERTLEELVSEQESEHRVRMVEYKRALSAWRKPAAKPQRPNKEIDADATRVQLETEFERCFRTPGEPELFFTLTYDNEVSKVSEDAREILRRNAVATTKVFLKFSCAGIEVCKTKLKPLTDNFTCHFEEYFALKLNNAPESVLMEIYEQTNTLVKRKITEVKLKIPPRSSKSGKMHENHFTKAETITYKHNAVGSGLTLQELLKNTPTRDDETLQTSGFVTFNLTWDVNGYNPSSSGLGLSEEVLGADGSIDSDKLNKWIEKVQPDPQDPKYSVVFDYLNECRERPDGATNKKTYFRCDPYAFPREVFTISDIEDNIRFKLLELRDKNVPEFVGTAIPNRLKEIPANIFSTYERRLAEENNEEYLQEEEHEYEINAHRSQGRKKIRQMHTKVFQLCRNSENNLTFEDVVNEKTIPFIQLFINNLLYNFLNWFRFQPAVSKPLPVIDFQRNGEEVFENKCPSKITIFLKSALNVPNRCERPRRKFSRSQSVDEGTQQAQVKPFVEVCYEQFISYSSLGSGVSPMWNEEIQFPLEINNVDHLNPSVLNGSITLNLYDDLSHEDAARDDIKETHFLGSVQVPVSAIAESQKLEGLFLVKTPTVLLGYEKCEDVHHSARSNVQQTFENHVYVSMKISIEPNIPKLSPDMQSLQSSEPPYLRDHIIEWNFKYNTEHNQRKFSALAIDSNGKTVCVSRFIKSLEPPQINADGFDVTPEQCARYVSLIPFTDSNKFYQNIWLSTEQMLKLGVGSVIDHAVALTCYLLSLNVEAWLVLGFGLPHGSTAFVLVREYSSEATDPLHFIFDVTTGFKYNSTDSCCPLKRIYCVFNENNLWGNIQRGDDIPTTRFDFSRRFDWTPLFDKRVTSPSNSVQQKLIYVSTFDTAKIQASIEKKLRKKIAKSRRHDRTVLNHYVCNTLKNSMGKFEVNMMHGKSYTEMPVLDEMSKGYKITGCLFNLPFYSVGGIVERVINSKLHQVQGDFEFAVGVYVHAYPNQVISVWAVLLRISKKN